MRWIWTWKPPDEHPIGRKAKARIVILGFQYPEVRDMKMSSAAWSRPGRMLTLQWSSVPMQSPRSCKATDRRGKTLNQSTQEHLMRSRVQ